MTKKYKLSSNFKTCWDEFDSSTLSPIESFIQKEYKYNYEIKHLALKYSSESFVLNEKNITKCPWCGSKLFVKNGFNKSYIQRYKCKSCNKTFTPTTGTLLENHKLPLESYIEFLLNLFRYQTINSVARNNKNSWTTSRYWLEKTFMILKDYQKDIVLKDFVYIDETYVSKIKSLKTDEHGKVFKERSKTQFCIGIGCDKNNVIASLESMGHPSYKSTKKCFYNHIKRCSVLVHDSEKTHRILLGPLLLTNAKYNASKQLKNVSDKENPLFPINEQCKYLKRFLKRHSGFDRDHLQDYLNLFCFIQNPPHDPLEKVEKILKSLYLLPVSLKYRNYYSKTDKLI